MEVWGSESGKSATTARVVGLGVALMGVVVTPSLLVTALFGKAWGLGLALVEALWLAGPAASRHLALPVAGLMGCAAALLGGRAVERAAAADDVVHLATPERASWADLHGGASFDDAHVEAALFGVHSMEAAIGLPSAREHPGASAWFVAPVVGSHWTRERPVHLWALCRGPAADACREGWARPLREVAPIEGSPRPGACALAIADAERARGLRSAPGAPCVLWVADVVAHERQGIVRPVAAALAVVALWVLGVPLLSLPLRRRRARSEPG